MATSITIEPKASTYEDLPLTNFPSGEDNWNRMSDINLVLMPLVTKFNEYYKAGNLSACNKIITDNPELLSCFFNADKFNQLRDAILALERYYLEEVQDFIYTVAQNAIGITDNPTNEQLDTTAYTARFVKSLQNTVVITLSASNWSNSAPYSQRIAVSGVKGSDKPTVSPWTPKTLSADASKLQTKMASLITAGETENGYVTIYCGYKKPTSDFQVVLRGISI